MSVLGVRGIHIVFEGPDSVGKSTQIALTEKYLLDEGFDVVLTREPGGTPVGLMLRKILLDTDIEIDPRAEALMMAADRAADVAQVIAPSCEQGRIVLSDRYIPSSLVYQGVVRGLGIKEVAELSAFAVGEHTPDVILCFDLEDDLARSRAASTPDRIEKEGEVFHQQIRETYRQLAADESWSVVDARGTQEEVFARIVDLISPHLPNQSV